MNPEQFSAWPQEKKLLHDLVMTSPGDFVIEVGAYQGGTSKILGDACSIRRKRLVICDPWDDSQDGSSEEQYAAFTKAAAQYRPIVHRCRSADFDTSAYLGKCALVFIDGLHTYEGVRADIAKFAPCCAPGGFLAVHDIADSGWLGVKEAVDEHFAFNEQMTMRTLVYHPSADEVARYSHGVSGVAYWQPRPI